MEEEYERGGYFGQQIRAFWSFRMRLNQFAVSPHQISDVTVIKWEER